MQKNFIQRKVEGDASETGLVKFVQPILDKRYGGEYDDGLNEIRSRYPIMRVGENTAVIPFSSDIKFNLIIRDLNTLESRPRHASDNMAVFLKGAPERVLNRCSTILVDGVELPFDKLAEFET